MEGSSASSKRRSPPPRSHSPAPGSPSGGTTALSFSSRAHQPVARGGAATNEYLNSVHMAHHDPEELPQVGLGRPMGGEGSEGFAYSTTLRRQPSYDHGGPMDWQPPIPIQTRGVLGFIKRRAQRLGLLRETEEYLPMSMRDEVEHAVGGVRRAVDPVADLAQRAEQRRTTETPSAKFAHMTVEQTLEYHQTSESNGLVHEQIAALRTRHGPNEFQLAPAEPLFLKFLKQIYESPLILLLLASSVVSALVGNLDDAGCVVVAVGIVLTVGFIQEQRSEKSLEALNKLVPHFCHLTRDGQISTPLANALVPGDLISFSVGDRVPADVRLLSAVALEIDESALTGETRPAKKTTTACDRGIGEDTHGEGGGKALSERKCVAYMGTLVRSGHGSGIVVGTGTDTEFGVIFSMMQDVEEKRTPLQLSMDDLAKRLSFMSFAVIGIIVLIGVYQKRGWLEMFTIGVSLAVAAIPEGLPIVTTVTLALGVLRMSKRKAIVKKLPSVEALGSVSVICSDKTGTLTKNEMTVTHAYTVDDLVDLTPYLAERRPPMSPSHSLVKAVQIGSICNNAFRNEFGVNVGQATDVALMNILSVVEIDDPRADFTRKTEVPFSSETKTMAVVGSFGQSSQEMTYVKGAIEQVLSRCRYYYVTDSSTPSLDPSTRDMILARATEVAKRGLRVIAMAYGLDDANLVFVGFQAMMDPPRRGVAASIAALHTAGVQVVMITGDAEHTALAIARELGLKVNPSGEGGRGGSSCMLGSQVELLNERELIERVAGVTVFARTTPRHKMAIVKAWQMRGAVVAMTGDGVNDAPALKMADIGISMGKSGTDVAKEAADVILVDDDFSSILPAVEEGKSIFYNIQNFLTFQLSTAVAALTLITLSTMFQLANPLNAMQILFINILMDGPPAQALGVDPVDKEVMRRPPRKKNSPVLNGRLMARVLFSGTIIVLGTLFIYAYEISDGSMSRRDQTMTFTCFVFLDLVSAVQSRGLGCGLFRNRMLSLTVSVSFFCQLGLVYIPILQHIFQTEALSLRDLFMLLGLAGTSMALHEARRWYERRLREQELRELDGGLA